MTAVAAPTFPVKPITDEFDATIAASVAHQPAIRTVVADVIASGLDSVYFVGAGASHLASDPAYQLLVDGLATPLPIFQVQSDELNTRRPRSLGARSLVMVTSFGGRTKETVAAAELARSLGATVVSVGAADSPLAAAGSVSFAGDTDLILLTVAVELLAALDADARSDERRQALAALPGALRSALDQYEEQAGELAQTLSELPFIYVVGSGPSHGWAYGTAMCWFQESQWKQAISFNSGEFFQGAFEMVDANQPILVFLGEDATRPMGERVLNFMEKYVGTANVFVIDTRPLDLPGIPADLRGEFSAILFKHLIERVANHLQHLRGHDLMQRKYMFKLEY